MTREEYETTQAQLVIVAQMAAALDLAEFIRTAEIANATGPILDPTLFRRAGRRLDALVALARSAMPFVAALRELQALVLREEGAKR